MVMGHGSAVGLLALGQRSHSSDLASCHNHCTTVDDARKSLRGLERQKRDAGPIGRLRLRDQLATARLSLERAQDRYDLAVVDARPARAVVEQAVDHQDALRREQDIERTRQRFNDYAREALTRPVPELGISR